MEVAKAETRRVQDDLTLAQANHDTIRLELANRESDLNGLKAALEESHASQAAELSSLRQQVQQRETITERAETLVRQKGEEIAAMAAQIKQLSGQNREVREGKRQLEFKVRDLEAKLAELGDNHERASEELKRLRVSLSLSLS